MLEENIDKNLKEIYGNQINFKVKEDYFDGLAMKVQDKISYKTRKQVDRDWSFYFKPIYIYLPSLIVLLVLIPNLVTRVNFQTSHADLAYNSVTSEENYHDEILTEINIDEFEDYIVDNNIEISNVASETNDELMDYLVDEVEEDEIASLYE